MYSNKIQNKKIDWHKEVKKLYMQKWTPSQGINDFSEGR